MSAKKTTKIAAAKPAKTANAKAAKPAAGKKSKATKAETAANEGKTSKVKREPKAKKRDGKLSAIDAAAKVLGESGEPMTCRELIEAMGAKGYWTSPGGQTPWATLYSSLLREINAKGKDARFVKTERGKFTIKK